jgi:iron complex outermembrane receptor protein
VPAWITFGPLLLGALTTVARGQQAAAPPAATTRPTTAPTTAPAPAEALPTTASPSLDDLLNTEVTLVSRRPERVAEAASAVQVITGEDIHRSAAVVLPEALRLAPNLQVAQFKASSWAITSRGLNGAPDLNSAFANKLLVMIDGRSVYSPLFGGVFWDTQNVLLEDVDRIEVVSGPGGTLWGANAVNGVINVVTKSARDTQGLYLTQITGNAWQDYTAMRYGGSVGDDFFYRVYGLGFDRDSTVLADGTTPANDAAEMAQGGFRTDYYPDNNNTLTIQGDSYGGSNGQPTVENASGGNVLGRFTHVFSERSDLVVQTYLDVTSRQDPNGQNGEALEQFDIDAQHRFPIGDRNDFIWGLEYRGSNDDFNGSPTLSFDPPDRYLNLYSGFVQDEVTLVPERLKLTLGTKLEHNDYTGFEWQPGVRLALTPTDRQTVWAAVSRAVRSPSRLDVDEITPSLVTHEKDFESENVLAYELGYRVRPIDPLALSVAGFYNRYDDLQSIDYNPAPPPVATFANNQEAETYGVEFSGEVQVNPRWRIRGGYTLLLEDIRPTADSVIPVSEPFVANDPRNQFLIQSIVDLPANFQFDTVFRYVDTLYLAQADVPAYFELDARLAWHYRNVELALVGQNLLDNLHREFGTQEIPRSLYGRLTVRW